MWVLLRKQGFPFSERCVRRRLLSVIGFCKWKLFSDKKGKIYPPFPQEDVKNLITYNSYLCPSPNQKYLSCCCDKVSDQNKNKKPHTETKQNRKILKEERVFIFGFKLLVTLSLQPGSRVKKAVVFLLFIQSRIPAH